MISLDDFYMVKALQEAKIAFEENEIPVGAIVVCNDKIIAKAYNQTEKLTDCTAHAEMLAISAAQNSLNTKFLTECTIYTTLEPCVMCAGAIFWSRVGKLVYGAKDPKRGFLALAPSVLHNKTEVISDIKATECEKLLLDFFKKLRN